jgi:hypothetical protein
MTFPLITTIPAAAAGGARTLGSTDVLTGGTASQKSTYATFGACNAVDDSTATYAQSGTPDCASFWWQYDFGAGNSKMLGQINYYWDGAQSASKTVTVQASATGAWSGEEVTIASGLDFVMGSGAGWYNVSWVDPDGTSTYRYWRINSLTCINTSNGLRPIHREFEAYEYA